MKIARVYWEFLYLILLTYDSRIHWICVYQAADVCICIYVDILKFERKIHRHTYEIWEHTHTIPRITETTNNIYNVFNVHKKPHKFQPFLNIDDAYSISIEAHWTWIHTLTHIRIHRGIFAHIFVMIFVEEKRKRARTNADGRKMVMCSTH